MQRARLVEEICESEEARLAGPNPGPEECCTTYVWIGLADFEDFLNPHFLATKGIAYEQSDDYLEVSYYVQFLDEESFTWGSAHYIMPAAIQSG